MMRDFKPMKEVDRLPRKDFDNMKDFKVSRLKASEVKSMLLYYILPVMQYILPRRFFAHLALLVEVTEIFESDVQTPDRLDRAERLAIQFVEEFPLLYKRRDRSALVPLNFHNLIHGAQVCRRVGSLSQTSCFNT